MHRILRWFVGLAEFLVNIDQYLMQLPIDKNLVAYFLDNPLYDFLLVFSIYGVLTGQDFYHCGDPEHPIL